MTQDYSQSYGQKLYFQLVRPSAIDLSKLALGSLGTGKFMDISTLMPNANTVKRFGTGDTFKIFSGAPKTVTNAALATNEVTLTFAAAHGFTVGQSIVVSDLPAPFVSVNGTYTVKAATTTSPHTITFDKTGTNIPSAAVASGTVLSGVLALDGTDPPIRMLGLTNLQPNEGENEESTVTYDDEAQGFDSSMATSKTHTVAVAGIVRFKDAAYKLMRIASMYSVKEQLMIKWVLTAPNGEKEDTYGYGRFTGYQPENAAGTIVKFQQNIRTYGPAELEF
jgi:hypothetical protein